MTRRNHRVVVFLGLVTVVLTVCGFAAAPHVNAATTITADYNSDQGAFDQSKYLNANEGGYLDHNSLNWLPESYPQLKNSGLRLVTITHLLNENFYNIVSGAGPNFSYDFSKLDRVVLPLVKQGLTPVMGLQFSPQVLGGADKATGYDNAIPNNNAYWQLIVQHLVQHYKDLGYTGWYWEVWNEPSLNTFWNGTEAQYNAMYQASAAGVKAADATAKVGGPAVNAPNLDFMTQFLSYIKANPAVPLDFVSFHAYGGTFDIDRTVKEAHAARPNVTTPIFVTEWNSTAEMSSGPGTPPDTNAGAAYAARRLAEALSKPALTKVFYFSAKEGLTPSKLFNGDLGLMTVDNHRKAALNTMQLYSKMQSRILVTNSAGTANPGTGAVATKDPATGKTTVLAWNDNTAPADLSLRLDNLPYQQNIKVNQYLVDATHGNYYHDFASGIKGWDIGPRENADPQESRIVPGASTFTRSVTMGAGSVVEYVLEPTSDAVTETPQHGPVPIPPGSRDLAYGMPVTASSTVDDPRWSTAALTDGLNHSTPKADNGPAALGWSSGGSADPAHPEWASVDLGHSAPLTTVKLLPRDDKDCEGSGFPGDVTIQGSNDSTKGWTDVASEHNATATAHEFPVSGSYRYLRVYATNIPLGCQNSSIHYFQLAEIQAYSNVNLASGAAVTTNSTGGEVNLGHPVIASRVDLTSDGDPDRTIAVAADQGCTTWTTVASANQPNPGKYRRTYGFAPREVRCIRVNTSSPRIALYE